MSVSCLTRSFFKPRKAALRGGSRRAAFPFPKNKKAAARFQPGDGLFPRFERYRPRRGPPSLLLRGRYT